MSFLDDQATGQIGIGERASLDTLTRRKRKRKRGQDPAGAQTYSLMPQDEFSNIVSSPTNITQVNVGKKLQAQGTNASSVGNVFRDYTSAAPIGPTIDAIYPPPNDDDEKDDDEEEDAGATDKLPDISPDTGINDPFSGNFQDHFAVDDPTVTADQSQAVPGTEGPDFFSRGDISEAQSRGGRQPGDKTFSEWAGGIGKGIAALSQFLPSRIAVNLLSELTGGKPTPSTTPGYVPGREFATGRPAKGQKGYVDEPIIDMPVNPLVTAYNTGSRAQQAIDSFADSTPEGQDTFSPGASAPGVDIDTGAGGDYGVGGSGYSGEGGGWTPFASGGTVKAKAKKVPSFMDSK